MRRTDAKAVSGAVGVVLTGGALLIGPMVGGAAAVPAPVTQPLLPGLNTFTSDATVVVPAPGTLTIEAVGAAGSAGAAGGAGGAGADVVTTVTGTAAEQLTVDVGGNGAGSTGGSHGGGPGGTPMYAQAGGGGGGFSGVLAGTSALLVAGGGGGGGGGTATPGNSGGAAGYAGLPLPTAGADFTGGHEGDNLTKVGTFGAGCKQPGTSGSPYAGGTGAENASTQSSANGGGGGGGGYVGGGGGGTGSACSAGGNYSNGFAGAGGGGGSSYAPTAYRSVALAKTAPQVLITFTPAVVPTPPVTVPESPLAVAVPAAALIAGGLVLRRRRHR